MIALIGTGRETRALATRLRAEQGDLDLIVLDEAEPDPEALAAFAALGIEVRTGVDLDDPGALPTTTTAVYRSPGVPPSRPALAAAAARGLAITTPTGWWTAHRDNGDVIAITGTKGKSTTAALVAHLLRADGRTVSLVGNIGRAAVEVDPTTAPADDIVLELSSYQLADLVTRRPFAIGVVTTLLRDHVPWHGSLERYHADKLRLLTNARTRIVSPSVAAHPAVRGRDLDAVAVTALRDRIATALAVAGLHGDHLVDDAALALAAVDARRPRPGGVAALIDALTDFTPLPHRQTPVATVDGRRFVDDSISTIPESAVAAIRSHLDRGPVTVLLGGDDRGQDLAPLVDALGDERVTAIVLGPLATRLEPALAGAAGRVHRVEDLEAAVDRAVALTPRGGTILLSPAAPSFHAHRDFVARGERFVALVDALAAGHPTS
ncbi:MAG: UDP-N-acetylmuramoyl-L-alanine--D-glutamate ligase [Nitriliruptoraceae bacterium]|nr:UDP-N-acetylmuramoyl-L-alanine--D-glutamate ligase [Nitriliruptoraceae bacterium]